MSGKTIITLNMKVESRGPLRWPGGVLEGGSTYTVRRYTGLPGVHEIHLTAYKLRLFVIHTT